MDCDNMPSPMDSFVSIDYHAHPGGRPFMQMNTRTRPSVGADLSRTPPMYRPSVDVMMSALKS
jgi:hypothetical protein